MNPERNCQDFKTGTFEYEALIGTEVLSYHLYSQ